MNETSASVDAVDLADKLVGMGEKERSVIQCTVVLLPSVHRVLTHPAHRTSCGRA